MNKSRNDVKQILFSSFARVQKTLILSVGVPRPDNNIFTVSFSN
nr:hypothetical protein [Mycoplasmopsis bovis]